MIHLDHSSGFIFSTFSDIHSGIHRSFDDGKEIRDFCNKKPNR